VLELSVFTAFFPQNYFRYTMAVSFIWVRVRVMVYKTTFNNISIIFWQSVLLAEETGVLGENQSQTLSHNVLLSTPHHEWNSNS